MKFNWKILIIIIIVLSVSVCSVIYFSSPDKLSEINIEIFKITYQLLLIVIVGGFIKLMYDQSVKTKEEQKLISASLFDFVKRFVNATNVIRKAPILIESHRSKKTYGEQMRALIDVKLELSLIRHELESFNKHLGEDFQILSKAIREMENYIQLLIDEWEREYINLPVENAWNKIKSLEMLGDLRSREMETRFDTQYLRNYKTSVILLRRNMIQ